MDLAKRTLRPDELEKWLDFMCREIFPDDPRENVENMWYGDSAKDFGGIFVAVDERDNIISSVKVGCRNMHIHGTAVRTGIISGVGTKREFLNQGIVTQLFEMCRAYMSDKGAVISHLYSNPNTLAFYQRLGYLEAPQLPGEAFYRMYRVESPFSLGSMFITGTQQLIDAL